MHCKKQNCYFSKILVVSCVTLLPKLVHIIVVPWLSRVYVICTLNAVLCIPEAKGIHTTARRVQITYTLEAMVQLTCTIVHC